MNLWRVRIDQKSGRLLGRPAPVTTPSPYSGPMSISRAGKRVVYVQQLTTANIRKAGFDSVTSGWRTGMRARRKIRYPRWAPDGRRIAFHSNRAG
jgi:hypothetical protein